MTVYILMHTDTGKPVGSHGSFSVYTDLDRAHKILAHLNEPMIKLVRHEIVGFKDSIVAELPL